VSHLVQNQGRQPTDDRTKVTLFDLRIDLCRCQSEFFCGVVTWNFLRVLCDSAVKIFDSLQRAGSVEVAHGERVDFQAGVQVDMSRVAPT